MRHEHRNTKLHVVHDLVLNPFVLWSSPPSLDIIGEGILSLVVIYRSHRRYSRSCVSGWRIVQRLLFPKLQDVTGDDETNPCSFISKGKNRRRGLGGGEGEEMERRRGRTELKQTEGNINADYNATIDLELLLTVVVIVEEAVVQIIFANFVEECINEVSAGHNVERYTTTQPCYTKK
jgi:hypothetical protein